jgi:lysophospholipid acyltransferase (LPLAT)-like uncharacterized protein
LLKKKVFGSWDRFLLPYPFSRGLFVWGKPLWVSADATAHDVEAARRDLEAILNRMTAEADETVLRSS